jgi:fumarate hydratase subunit alpha
MREISVKKITAVLAPLCLQANTELPKDVLAALQYALTKESSKIGKKILAQIIQNASIAKNEKLPICQDTGTAVVFIELGQEIRLVDGQLEEAINEGIRQGYRLGYLRKSVATDPLLRNNSNDNTPAVIHTEIVPGDQVKIDLICKGGGAENRSSIKMFTPASTQKEIEAFILETVKKAGPSACPPMIIGVGIGGNFDSVTFAAKKALLRKIGVPNSNQDTAKWEKKLLKKINKLGIGPMGLGGKTTALTVNIEKLSCHISSLPVAVNIECHAHRYQEVVI